MMLICENFHWSSNMQAIKIEKLVLFYRTGTLEGRGWFMIVRVICVDNGLRDIDGNPVVFLQTYWNPPNLTD